MMADVAWTPLNLGAKLVLWLDAKGLQTNTDNEYGTVDAANRVSAWKDLSGNDYHFTQAVGGDQPLWDGTDKITFDGVSEYMNRGANDLLNEYLSNNSGECIEILSVPLDTIFSSCLLFSDNTINNRYVTFHTFYPAASGDDIAISIRAPAFNNAIRIIGTKNPNTFYLISCSSNGAVYRGFINGIEQVVQVIGGANDGKWGNDQAGLNNTNLVRLERVANFFYNIEAKSIIYCNDELTTAERNNLFTYLNNRFSVYP